jgi:NAD(P)-dependent dehydrogenase (short-subunit alcohol dehydrogenase family)
VTGAAGNVGMGTARSLAWLGAKIVIADVNARDGKVVEDAINHENKPGTALFVETDVSNEASMKAMANKAFDTFGKVDILVNNAMNMGLGARILDSTIQQLDRQYEISTRGTLIGIQQFLPGMRERHHGILTYMSTGMCYPIGPANYCAIKAATASLIMSLAGELALRRDRHRRVHVPSGGYRHAPLSRPTHRRPATSRRTAGETHDARYARLRRHDPARARRCRHGLLHHPC